MPRLTNRLTNAKIAELLATPRVLQPGKSREFRYPDGNGLYLVITLLGAAHWVLRIRYDGRERDIGLGSLNTTALAEARQKAIDTRRQVRIEHVDPIKEKRTQRIARIKAAKATTVRQAVAEFFPVHTRNWRGDANKKVWMAAFNTHVFPKVGDVPIREIDTDWMLAILEPIWLTTPNLGRALRTRMAQLLNWAMIKGVRPESLNPARWHGHLSELLGDNRKPPEECYHPALHYSEIPVFMRELDRREAASAYALRFLILTGTRTSETVKAPWTEIDLPNRLWTIPPERMKMKRQHIVPLSKPAIILLHEMKAKQISDFVFPGRHRHVDRPATGRFPGDRLDKHGMACLLQRMGYGGTATIHGFRSGFRTWADEASSGYDPLTKELAIAHRRNDPYARAEMFGERIKLLEEWGAYATSRLAPAKVMALSYLRRA